MILWGKKIEHHNIINDLMLKKQLTYKPIVGDGLPNGRGREQGRRGAPAPGPAEGERTPERTAGTRAIGEGAGSSGRTST